MPPKRVAAATTSASRATKKSRSSNDSVESARTNDVAQQEPTITPSNRWSAVSASRNNDISYRTLIANPLKAYAYICMCSPLFSDGDSDDEEDDGWDDTDSGSEEPDDVEKAPKPRCDGGKTCICSKPASEHPDNVWNVTFAGRARFVNMRVNCQVRSPDNFGMYTFNDHEPYGVVEVLQNVILDYEEAEGNWKEQWAICEGLAFFLKADGLDCTRIDDGELADETFRILGRMFMNTLAQLERDGLMAKDSEVKDLGMVMALWMTIPSEMRAYNILEDSKEESLGPAKDRKKWHPHTYDMQILAYAKRYDITLRGPHDIAERIEQVKGEGEAHLPKLESNTAKGDVFGFKKALKLYKERYASVKNGVEGAIGGDSLDITSWTSAERKKAAFNKKDPLSKKELNALKEGLVITMA